MELAFLFGAFGAIVAEVLKRWQQWNDMPEGCFEGTKTNPLDWSLCFFVGVGAMSTVRNFLSGLAAQEAKASERKAGLVVRESAARGIADISSKDAERIAKEIARADEESEMELKRSEAERREKVFTSYKHEAELPARHVAKLISTGYSDESKVTFREIFN
jgi:hypothetical protein